MPDQQARRSASVAIEGFRRYVTDYVNRHDFSVIPEFMAEDYTLTSSGVQVAGRDGAYRTAVARQLEQFPGLTFTPHELVHVGDRIAVRFTEHGASRRHGGALAAWSSIAIYTLRDGRLAHCAIEQDYYSRRRQLENGTPTPVDPPAIAPWDTAESAPNESAETVVRLWLNSGRFIETASVELDDSHATGKIQHVIRDGRTEILEIMSGGGKVAFHALQTGLLVGDLAPEFASIAGRSAWIHLSGLVCVNGSQVTGGHVIRDRWGLHRRLGKSGSTDVSSGAGP